MTKICLINLYIPQQLKIKLFKFFLERHTISKNIFIYSAIFLDYVGVVWLLYPLSEGQFFWVNFQQMTFLIYVQKLLDFLDIFFFHNVFDLLIALVKVLNACF